MKKIFTLTEHYTIYALLLGGMIYLITEMLTMGAMLWYHISWAFQHGLIDQNGAPVLRNTGVVFFNILIALELLETLKHYEDEHIVKAKTILLICIIAIARKIIHLDFMHSEYLTDIGVGVLLLAITFGYFLISKIETQSKPEDPTAQL
jgi:uncharacterized membrane protein (DUF373 family)